MTRKPILPRIHSIDGLRGLFAIGVMLYHFMVFSNTLSWWRGGIWEHFVVKIAIYGVCGFFVISGFSMYYIYGRKDLTKGTISLKFYYNRFLRIAPIFWMVCLIKIVIHYFHGAVIDGPFILKAFLNFSFLFGIFSAGEPSLVHGGWSIGIEWVFYFIFPAMIFLFKRSVINIFFITSAAIASWQFYNWFVFDPNIPGLEQNAFYAQPSYHAIFFVMGMVFGECYRRWPKAVNCNLAIVGVLIAFLILFISDVRSPNPINLVYGWSGTVFGLLVIWVVGLVAFIDVRNVFLVKICEFLGGISYPLYLMHWFVYQALFFVLDYNWITSIFGMGLTILLANWVHQYFEKPILKLKLA